MQKQLMKASYTIQILGWERSAVKGDNEKHVLL